MLDDATRRRLRFSLFLQAFAILMMSAALVLRATSTGFDAVTLVLVLALVVICAAVVFTLRQLRAG